MIIKNYTQFAKKTYWLGMDRSYVALSFLSLATILALLIILDYNPIPFFGLTFLFYMVSIIAFKRSPYWFEKFVIKMAIKQKYKYTLKLENLILGR